MADPRRDGAPSVTATMSGDMPTMSMAVRPSVAQDGLVTIGVVLDIPEPFGSFLRRSRADFGDPLAQAIPPHITLLPPTEVAPGIGRAINDHLAAVAAVTDPWRIELAGTASFRPVSPVAYVRVVDGAEGCDDLQRLIRTGPLTRALKFPYHPHVTVAHHLDDQALEHAQETLKDWSASFRASGLGHYEHGPDGVWRLRRRFAFGGNHLE